MSREGRSTVHFEEKGAGPLLVCLHGIGSSSKAFASQLEGLSSELRVVAWDAPGYGESPDPSASMDMAGYADAAAELIRRAGAPAFVLGVSWGGVIAAHVALRHRQLVEGIILVSASRGSGRDAASSAAMQARVAQLEELGPGPFAARRSPALLGPGASPELLEQVVDHMAGAIRLDGYRSAARAMAATDLTPRLGEIDTPALVICGSEDRVTGLSEGQALASALPAATLVVLRGFGHLLNQEAPDAVNAWVASFVSVVRGEPAGEVR